MSEEHDIQALLEEAIALSTADETQVGFGGGRLQVARFAGNRLRSMVEERWARLTMRAAWWQPGDRWRVGEAEVAGTQPKDLAELARWARESAQAREPTSAYVPLPYPGDFESTLADVSGAFDADTATAGPSLVADAIAELVLPSLRAGLTCEGVLALRVGTLDTAGELGLAALANMNGLFQYYKPTHITFSSRLHGPSGGLAQVDAESSSFGHLALGQRFERASARAALPLRPEAAPSGPSAALRVLFEPPAVASLLELLRPHFAQERVTIDASPFAARMQTQVFGPHVDLELDPGHPALLARPFDHVGWPRRPVRVVEGGVLRRLLVDRVLTPGQGVRDDGETGHEVGGYTELIDGVAVAVPRHLVMSGGAHSDNELLSELLEGRGDGLIVGRLTDAELVPPNTFRVSAMTGDDVYLVRDGRLECRLGPVRLVGQLTDWLGAAIALGQPVRSGSSLVPPIVAIGATVK